MSLLLWATDVHLDHLPVIEAAFEFGRALSNEQPTAIGLVVTGDIAEAHSVQRVLQDLAQGLGRPVYFVLGNQDDSRRALLRACADRAQDDARALEHHLAELIQRGRPRHVLVATHVPPFREAAWHEGKPSDDRWAPFFSSRALGEVLLRWADQNPLGPDASAVPRHDPVDDGKAHARILDLASSIRMSTKAGRGERIRMRKLLTFPEKNHRLLTMN